MRRNYLAPVAPVNLVTVVLFGVVRSGHHHAGARLHMRNPEGDQGRSHGAVH